MNNNKKSSIIVGSFAVLVVSVILFAMFTNFAFNTPSIDNKAKNQSTNISKASKSFSSQSSNSTSDAQSSQVVVTGIRTESISSQDNENKDKDLKQDSNIDKKDIKNDPNRDVSDKNSQQNNDINRSVVTKPDSEKFNNPESPNKPIEDNNVYYYRAPVIKEPVKEVIPYTPPFTQPQPPYNPPSQAPAPIPYTNPRYSSYLNSLSNLKQRGINILVPIVNNNNYLLAFENDSDLNNVLEYEFLVNSKNKNYGNYGSNSHLETLKCNNYIPNCKTILNQYQNGKFYINLDNLVLYT